MGKDRSTIVVGPGHISFGGAVFFVKDGIQLNVNKRTFEVLEDSGSSEQRLEDVDIEVQFTPAGQFSAAAITALYPYATPVIGTEIFGSVDKPVTIWGRNGKKYVISAGAITQQPDLILSARQTLFGAATIRGLCANSTARSAATSTLVITDEAYAGDAYAPASVKTVGYTAAWGSAPWDSISTEEGFRLSFPTSFEDILDDGHGIVGMVLTEAAATATFKPIGLTEADFLAKAAIQGTGVVQGQSLLTGADDLVIDGGIGNPLVTLKSACVMEQIPFRWGRGARRFDQVTLRAQRGGPAAPLFSIVEHEDD